MGQINNINWLKPWFYASLVDYYGASVSLSTIVLISEPWNRAILWTLGFNLIGSPCVFTYMFYRTFYKKGLKLKDDEVEMDEKIRISPTTKKQEQ